MANLSRVRAVIFLLFLTASAGAAQRGRIESTAINFSALRAGYSAWAAVVVRIQDGYHAQSHTPLDPNFIRFELAMDPTSSVTFGEPVYPPAQVEDYPALGKLSVYTGRIVVFVPIQVKADAKPGPVDLSGTIRFQACDANVCYPPEHPSFTIHAQLVAADAAVTPNDPELFKDVGKESAAPTTAPAASSSSGGGATPIVRESTGAGAIALRFATAFLVGLIFNVMPCVLPVLPLKAIGFYEASRHSRARSLAFGGVFSLGLIATFAVFGILIFGYHAFDWGQLFTKWWFTLGIVVVLLALAASTFGVFTVRAPTVLYNVSPRHDTWFGNFLFGILTALLSTPCTFGMFVALLAWAISLNQPLIGVLMLVAVGAGMASPYFALSALPEVARRFPRTGPWAELVRQMMGFLLLAVAVYFARPFLGRIMPGETFWWLPFAVIVIAAVFLAVRTFGFSRSAVGRVVGAGVAIGMIALSFGAVRRLTATPFVWQPFTQAAVDAGRGDKRIVLVEFTADWCGNCQYVEARVLHSPQVVAAVRDRRILMVKADVTRDDAPARPLLEKLDPAGSIPLTVIYPPGRSEPIELTGIYSVDDLRRAIDQAAG